MNEYFNEAVEVQGSEPDSVTGFRSYLEREFGITDLAQQDEEIELFKACLLVTGRKYGLIPAGDPIEALRQELIMEGITDPELQRPILQNYYREIVDPR